MLSGIFVPFHWTRLEDSPIHPAHDLFPGTGCEMLPMSLLAFRPCEVLLGGLCRK